MANPTSMILSAVHMLRHLGLEAHANRIGNALETVITESKVMTTDLGGKASTTDFTMAVISKL